jgi:acyl-CoA thioesterase FadM
VKRGSSYHDRLSSNRSKTISATLSQSSTVRLISEFPLLIVIAEGAVYILSRPGGCEAAMLTNLNSLSIYLHTSGTLGESWSTMGTTQSLNVQYLAAVPLGSWIDVETRVLSVGKNVALLACDIWEKDGPGKDAKRTILACTAAHTKIDNAQKYSKEELSRLSKL